MRRHPQDVQPLSHLRIAGRHAEEANNDRRARGLGTLGALSDELLLQVLHDLDPTTLAKLSCVSKALYCYSNHGDLWRAAVLSSTSTSTSTTTSGADAASGSWVFDGTWKQTYVALIGKASGNEGLRVDQAGVPDGTTAEASASTGAAAEAATQASADAPADAAFHIEIDVYELYSDVLYQPFLCSALDVDEAWLETENIDRRSNLTLEEFRSAYEIPNVPVIITDVVENWQAYRTWDTDYLRRAFGSSPVIVGDAPMSFDAYMTYCEQQHDEAPLYLFDKEFCDKAPAMAAEYDVPAYFGEDLFSALKEKRPDYRWLIYGPTKSGSTFHKDPNATSAWNAIVFGSKKWIMYPPHVMPPGVRQSDDGADVSCPVSLMEWMLAFYDLRDCEGTAPREAVVRRGEILFVPRGWWHCALNLEDTLAITQNYVSRANLRHVLNFLKSPHADVLVSGVPDEECVTLGPRFVEALEREGHGELLRSIEREEEAVRHQLAEKRKSSSVLAGCFGGGKRQANGGGFSFGFGL